MPSPHEPGPKPPGQFRPEPGKWYVSYPQAFGPTGGPVGGPFDTEDEAWDWMSQGSLIQGGVVWQCPVDDRR